jgi:addiction module HigA family antidote
MEKIRRNRRPSTPGAILKGLFLEDRKISVAALAEAIGYSRKHVSQIVHGKARVEPVMAARLGKTLGTSTDIWLDLQAAVDAWDANQEARDWRPLRPLRMKASA